MCTNQSLQGIFSIVKRIVQLIQIIVPILLIVFASISLVKLVKNPEEKKGTKKIINQFLAAAIIFFIPLLVDVIMNLVGDKSEISSCWNSASDKMSISKDYQPIGNKEKKPILKNATDYEAGVSNNCPTKVSKTRTSYNNNALKVDTSFYLDAHNIEFGNHYYTQSGVYDCEHIIVGQNKQYTVNGVTYKSSGRIVWYDIKTGERIANIDIGREGGHMDRLAYDSDRDIVLLHLSGSEKMLQIDNKTHTIMDNQKYSAIVGGDSKFIKYDSYHHQLIGLDGSTVTYYKYRESDNSYVKLRSISLDATSKWAPQNINTDGQVLYIANSNPGWDHADYAVITFDMKTGKMVEYHQIAPPANGEHIEDVVIDTEGSLWLIDVTAIYKAANYVANPFVARLS